MTGTDQVVTEFSFGASRAEKDMRLFASRVLPVLQHDTAFAVPPAPPGAPLGAPKPDFFAPG